MCLIPSVEKKNYQCKHAKVPSDDMKVIPAAKRVKLTPWQVYMKDFGDSVGI